MKQSNGDFSIGFWVRPLGQQSILRNGAFVPHLQFFSSLSPPKHNLVSLDCIVGFGDAG